MAPQNGADALLVPVQRGIAPGRNAVVEKELTKASNIHVQYFIKIDGEGVFYQPAGGGSTSKSQCKQALRRRLSPQTFIHPSKPFDFLPSFLAKGTGNFSLRGSKQGVRSSD